MNIFGYFLLKKHFFVQQSFSRKAENISQVGAKELFMSVISYTKWLSKNKML